MKPVCFELTLAVRRAGLKPRISARDDLPHFRLSLLEKEREREREIAREWGGVGVSGRMERQGSQPRESERSRDRESGTEQREREKEGRKRTVLRSASGQ